MPYQDIQWLLGPAFDVPLPKALTCQYRKSRIGLEPHLFSDTLKLSNEIPLTVVCICI